MEAAQPFTDSLLGAEHSHTPCFRMGVLSLTVWFVGFYYSFITEDRMGYMLLGSITVSVGMVGFCLLRNLHSYRACDTQTGYKTDNLQ